VLPLPNVRLRTWIYEISSETSLAGEQIFVFFGEFFPEYEIVYAIDENQEEVILLFLRVSHRS